MTGPATRPALSARARLVLTVLVAVAALVAPFVLGDYAVYQLSLIVVYIVAVLGFDLLTGFTGQVSLGQGAFFALGAYTGVIALTKLHVPYAATPILAGAVCFVVGTLFGRTVARLEGLYLALATFALAIATPQILKLDALDAWTGGSQGLNFGKPASALPGLIDDDRSLYLLCLAFAFVLYAGAWNLLRGPTGRALVALRDQPVAAATVGIDVAAYRSTAFGVSALCTGVAGALGALVAGFVSPDSYTLFLSIQILVGGVIGGITAIGGAIVGGAFIEVVPDLVSKISDAAPWALYGLLLIVCIMVMPGGVAGLARSILHATRTPGKARPR
jgi:branched-chain amino acid transport system permease protein